MRDKSRAVIHTQMNEEIAKFTLIAKRILKSEISTVPATLVRYKEEIITAYAVFVTYCQDIYTALTEEDVKPKEDILQSLNYVANKFEECLIKLKCQYNLSECLFEFPEIADVKIIGIEVEEPQQIAPEEQIVPPVGQANDIALENITNNPIIMALTTPEFLKLSSSTINYKFSGDPLGLPSFIDAINLLQTLATTATLQTFLVAFIKTKLDGKAREYIDATHTTIEQIITSLRANIKPDNSKVVEGRMLALRLTNSSQDEFSKKVEELSESLRRSLIIEGMSAQKATEISIEKTIDLCRSQTKNEIVKAVLESSTFSSSKDVVAKLLTQSDKARKEHQILTYSTNRNQVSNRGRPNFNNNPNNHINNQRRGTNRLNRNDTRNSNPNGGFTSDNRSGSFNRGRGRGSGNNNNNRGFHHNYNGSSNRQPNNNGNFQNHNNFNNNNGQYVRVVTRDAPGNPGVPHQFMMGANEM